MPKKSLTNLEFVSKSKDIHGDKYDYSLVDYQNNKIKVKINCPEHGIFEQTPTNHFRGRGCKFCVYDNLKSNTDKFIEESKKVHGDIYIYSGTTYSGCYKKVIITCPIHGDFQQKAYSHKQGRGCPVCSNSTGEQEIKKLLIENGVEFIHQYKFDDCKNVFPLRFDFYLPEYNICIEYDGEQHFRPMGFSGGDIGFKRTVKNDKIKNQYCNKNNIGLLRVRFDEDIKTKIQSVL